MIRISVPTIALGVAISTAAHAEAPTQQGNPQERAAWHPDVVKFCKTQLEVNPNDLGGILNCLQTNRAMISTACQKVLSHHGQ
jgi:hypothetical protein